MLCIDSRGHGASEWGAAPLTPEQMAQDVLDVLDALRQEHGHGGRIAEHVHAVGFSDGGNIALAMAMARPDTFDTLTLAGANLNPWGVKLRYQAPIVLGYGLCKLATRFHPAGAHNLATLNLMVHHPHYTSEQLADIHSPALVLAGGHDMIRQKHTELIAASLPHARLEIIPNASHFLFDKQADATNSVILQFLKER